MTEENVQSEDMADEGANEAQSYPHIPPTVGRVVHYRPIGSGPGMRHAAIVAFVHNPSVINLMCIDENGEPYSRRSVTLVQDPFEPKEGDCEWMKYQKGQAAKSESLAEELSNLSKENVIDFDNGAEYDVDTEAGNLKDEDAGDDGVVGDGVTEFDVNDIAKLCHEQNRAYCASIGDDSQPHWEDAPEWQKESAIAGVQAVIDNPETTPEESHIGWMEQKIADGWVYGEVKDPEAKTHPCLVDYAELSEDHRGKDTLFINTVRSAIGMEDIEVAEVS